MEENNKVAEKKSINQIREFFGMSSQKQEKILCLSCERPFLSEDRVSNRICGNCKEGQSSLDLSEYSLYDY